MQQEDTQSPICTLLVKVKQGDVMNNTGLPANVDGL